MLYLSFCLFVLALSLPGYMLNITRITRGHMGTYMCIADNGIPPRANQTFILDVHCECCYMFLPHMVNKLKTHLLVTVPPLIRTHTQSVGAANKSHATLECEVEAFPEAVRYWERMDNRVIENGTKFVLTEKEHGGYKLTMKLIVLYMTSSDFGEYYCVAKNEHGMTRGRFRVYGKF